MLRFANPKSREQAIQMFDGCNGYDAICTMITQFGDKYGAKPQAILVNELYVLAQQRGYNVSGAASLGNTISIQQNDAVQRLNAPRNLTERQVAAVARDLMNYTAREIERSTEIAE